MILYHALDHSSDSGLGPTESFGCDDVQVRFTFFTFSDGVPNRATKWPSKYWIIQTCSITTCITRQVPGKVRMQSTNATPKQMEYLHGQSNVARVVMS